MLLELWWEKVPRDSTTLGVKFSDISCFPGALCSPFLHWGLPLSSGVISVANPISFPKQSQGLSQGRHSVAPRSWHEGDTMLLNQRAHVHLGARGFEKGRMPGHWELATEVAHLWTTGLPVGFD